MNISFRPLTASDEAFLADTLKSAFDSDSELAYGSGIKLGPPGYDNGHLAKRIIENSSDTKLVLLFDQIPGGILVYKLGTTNLLHYFCLDPTYIGKQLGTKVWNLFEKEQSGRWEVETPAFSIRNHHFYEKIGFTKVGEKNYGPDAVAFVFEKDLDHLV